jgi:hypothetical protein
MSTAPDGLVSLAWPTRTGYGYRVETSSDLTTDAWQPLATFYGNGGTLSIPVAQITPPGAQPPPAGPPVNVRSAHFTLRAFPGMNKTLVVWNQPGQTGLSQVLLDGTDFSTVLNLPLFFGKFADPANGIDYLLSFVILGGDFDPAYDLLTPALLSPEETERLAWFTDRLAEVKAAMEAAQANGQATNNVPATNAGSGGPGVQMFFRLVELYQDSDGDGILDHHERDVTGTDPWDADSDNDGFSDGAEFEAGSDPHNANSTPANDPGGPPGSDLPFDGDQDEDYIPNALDADPLDKHVDWERRAFPNFIVLPIPDSVGRTLEAVNNRGEVVMNLEGIGNASYWKPGAEKPVDLPIGDLEIATSIYSHMDGNTPVRVPVTFTISRVIAHDINDAGVIVGEGIFYPDVPLPGTSPGGGGKTTSTSTTGPDNSLTIAIRWTDPESDPTLVHPGVVEKGDWGGILLSSTAVEINEAGTVRGEADYAIPAGDPNAEPPFEIRRVSALWTGGQGVGEGKPLYKPEEPVPSPLPLITSMAREQSHFTGSSDGAALWEEWKANPTHPFPEAGSRSVRISKVPNGSQAIAGDLRLMLRNHYGNFEPALRTYGNGFAVTESGTVWFMDQTSSPSVPSLWNPLESGAVSSRTTPQPLAVSRIADVASKDVAIAESPSGNVLLLPVGALVTRNSIQARIIGPAAHPLDDWRFGRDLRVAKFGGGDFIGSRMFLEKEPDAFRLFLCGLPLDFSPKVTVRTSNLPEFAVAHNDNATAVTLTYDPLLGGFATKTMFLATGDGDDDYSSSAGQDGDNIGADDQPEDRSHKLLIGGRFIVDELQYKADKPPVTVDAQFPLPLHASVTINIIPVMIGGLPALPDSEIDVDIEAAREVYSQVGLQLNINVGHPITVPGTVLVGEQNLSLNLVDGLDIPDPGGSMVRAALTDEEKAFLTHAATSGIGDIQVFYIRKFNAVPSGSDDTVGGFAYIPYEVDGSEFDPGTFRNSIIIARDPRDRYTLAHELGHVLTADLHVEEPNNLMFAFGSENGDITDSKRLSDDQESVILMSPLLDDND